jgi:hypothetical protein
MIEVSNGLGAEEDLGSREKKRVKERVRQPKSGILKYCQQYGT